MIKKILSFSILLFFINAADANTDNVMNTTLTVKNMTGSSLIIQSELVNGFINNPNIQINGVAQQTPVEIIPSQGSNNFIITNNGMKSVVTGGINLCVQGTEACGYFPMWAGGDGQDHTIWINAPLSATSNNQYIVGAYEIDENHAVLNVYPAVKK